MPLNCRLVRKIVEEAVYIIALRLAKYGARYLPTNSGQLIMLKATEMIKKKMRLDSLWSYHQAELVDLSEWPSRGVRLKTSEVFQEISKDILQAPSTIIIAANGQGVSGQFPQPITCRRRAVYALSSERQATSSKNKQLQEVVLWHVPRGFSYYLMTEKTRIMQDS